MTIPICGDSENQINGQLAVINGFSLPANALMVFYMAFNGSSFKNQINGQLAAINGFSLPANVFNGH